uniref:Endonuclease/exonuclease/phosphatase domain-containing protein n=2 Tax=Cajanus cajan TaxID=3821 RepID=A0A151T1W0_CAJCA|nr:hypothetical protein KK1_023479 [Cajanus cajan]
MVYASPHLQERSTLWNNLTRLAQIVDGPWNLMGDFNVVLRPHERMGSATTRINRGDIAFNNFVNQCNLLDIGFTGSPFTWKRGQLFERLDRSLENYDWRIQFHEASIIHLNPLKSDHVPLLLRFADNFPRRPTRRPFKFEASWLTHEDFPQLMKREWNANGQ